MKPLRMELEGFARFLKPQVISFEDLSLFAIAGPTGAGKTLILDAICFALYGVTPRLSQKLEGLVSSGSDRLVVDLQFEVGSGTYRAVRTIERKASGNHTKSTRVEQLVGARWKLVPETEKLKEADAKLEQLVGFDFKAFTRSILLPQGKFDEFLHGDARQRRSLLKELLDLTRVERMREEAGIRERADTVRLEGINARMQSGGLEQAPDTLRRLKSELAGLLEAQAELDTELVTSRQEHRQAEEVAGLHAELAALLPELELQQETQRQEPALRRELEQGRRAAALLPLLAHAEQLHRQLQAATTDLAGLDGRLQGAEEAARVAGEVALAAGKALDSQEPALRVRVAQLQQLRQLAQLLERHGGAPAGGDDSASQWDEEAFGKLQELTGRLPALSSAEARLTRLGGRIGGTAAQIETAATDREVAAERLAELLTQGKSAGLRVEQLEAQVAKHELTAGETAVRLRHSLALGEECPVCGQPVHELPAEHGHGQDQELLALQQVLTEARTARQQLRERYQEQQGVLAGLEARLASLKEQQQEATDSLDVERAELAGIQAGFAAAGFTGTAQAIGQELQEARNRLLAAATALLHGATGGLAVAEAVDQAEAKLTALQKDERRAATASTEASHALNLLQEQIGDRRREQAERQESLTAQRGELERQLKEAGFGDDAELRAAARGQDRLRELEQQLERASREHGRLQAREAELRKALAGREVDGGKLEALAARIPELEQRHVQMLERRGGLQAEILSQKNLVSELGTLLKERRILEDGRERWKLLARDLQDHNFTDYLLSGMQKRLAAQASRIIRQVTDGRFDLHLSAGREFEVSDAWAGGERRTARSLSGGETFIVSLALALALSDTAAGGRRLGALFLDEGFGTLDALTLDAVAGVLENLSGNGRLVGIITHVPELSERLPARLLVQKSAEGSTAYWED